MQYHLNTNFYQFASIVFMKTQYPGEAIKIVSMSRTKQTVVCMAGSLSLNMAGN